MLAPDPDTTLVLMACSATKIETGSAVPLHELYDGPLWQTLRAHRGAISWWNVCVLSGKLGFTSACTYARPYEARLSAAAVDGLLERGILTRAPPRRRGTMPGAYPYGELNHTRFVPEGQGPLGGRYEPRIFAQVIVCGSGEYRRGLSGLVAQFKAYGVVSGEAPVMMTEGAIGVQRYQLGTWLRAVNGRAEPVHPSAAPAAGVGPRRSAGWSGLPAYGCAARAGRAP